jgi:hypothetical protein
MPAFEGVQMAVFKGVSPESESGYPPLKVGFSIPTFFHL